MDIPEYSPQASIDSYLKMIARLEPDLHMLDRDTALASMAVSFRRLADAAERANDKAPDLGDWFERIKLERAALNSRATKLADFTETLAFGMLPDVEKALLALQLHHMVKYRSALDDRILLEEQRRK